MRRIDRRVRGPERGFGLRRFVKIRDTEQRARARMWTGVRVRPLLGLRGSLRRSLDIVRRCVISGKWLVNERFSGQ